VIAPPTSIVAAAPTPQVAPAPSAVKATTPATSRVGAPTPSPNATTHAVRPGDNLWTIARDSVAARDPHTRVDDATVAAYGRRAVDTSRATLRSGDPTLIFPGELLTLPPIGLP